MNKYGIENTHRALYERLYEYISSQYFGSSTLLQNAVLPQLKKEGVLYRAPYIEANSAYETAVDGIANAYLPEHIKKLLLQMADKKLGVFQNPFKHQVKALEKFINNKDLFIATGTGSGKTECFMWPMIASIGDEVYSRKNTWEIRGVRALFLYPMNALVSDQVSRLRRIIGDTNGEFRKILKDMANDNDLRMPQFGMYTGRTPYPGTKNDTKDKELAKALTNDILNAKDEIKSELIKLGKYPAKIDLEKFVDGLKKGEHLTSSDDAELITRTEMQSYCPDILITNYSMLEYMLMRQEESKIWEDTKLWLNASKENKLLFVIDEAHMYRGSAGGEVALLIKRVMYRLGIDKRKIRFILTSASMPHETKEDEESMIKFACDFTSRSIEDKSFELVFGTNENLPDTAYINLQAEDIMNTSIDDFQGEDAPKLAAINTFCSNAFKEKVDFDNVENACNWLYFNLLRLEQCRILLKKCRGNATAYEELAAALFPNASVENARLATQVVLAISTLAKDKDGKVLFPSRLHMFFRGLRGVYACTNPNCPDKHSYGGITIGKIYLDSYYDTCSCGGKIFELVNHRRCGALFIKGFLDSNINGKQFIWQNAGIARTEQLREIHLFIVDDTILKKDLKNAEFRWLDPKTGILCNEEKEGYLRVVYSLHKMNKNKDEVVDDKIISFYNCPKCSNKIGKQGLTDFATKGNIPFYNIVSAQLLSQPQVIFEKEILKKFPNGGRKVLLFSDSRQRAAILAKDMTRSADDNAARQTLVKAVIRMQNYSGKCEKNIDILYPIFLQIACEDNVHFFYGSDEEVFNSHMREMYKKIEFANETGRPIKYEKIVTDFKNKPELYIQQLLKLVCDNYQSLSDLALCWMEPSDIEYIETLSYKLEKKGIQLSQEELNMLVANWCISVAKDSIAVGEDIDDYLREPVQKNDYGRYGIKENSKLQNGIALALEKRGFNNEQIEEIKREIINEFSTEGKNNLNKFIMTSKVALRYEQEHKWYKCEKCSEVSAFHLWGLCPCCGSEKIRLMEKQDFETLSFWRKPVEDVIIRGKQIKSINTEEHTAQLSHKDQREDTWSTTENFEMRFQDISIDKDMPVDVLSCTTTMEVGIDIGSLSAVALRNVPPMRENYQQRAGRAGRRNSSISTITTYAHNGAHDNWYFSNPREIISGKVRKPWIDVGSLKLIKRHLFIIVFNEFLMQKNSSIDKCLTLDFFSDYYEEFKGFVEDFRFSKEQEKILVPDNVIINFEVTMSQLDTSILKLKEDVEKHPEKYDEANEEQVTMLDSLFDEGLLPTYSFPKNVVGFYIEDDKGKIVQKPDRALDIAISEYAPGRTLVVNKKTYKCGGIYSHSSKYRKGEKSFTKPAEAYFNDKNYFMPIYMCGNRKCEWFGTDMPTSGKCPFCGSSIEGGKYMLKPWGFAPENGVSTKESEADTEFSLAEDPCYSAPPKDDMQITKYVNLKIANRYDENITIINKGPNNEGFTICKKCGAAIAGNKGFTDSKIKSPYKMYGTCRHEEAEYPVLGHSFRTDMLVLQIEIDPEKINTSENGLWLNSATISLSEALKIAASRVLDIEFNDIKVGHRIRYYEKKVFVDIFIYDSLSSGAGYAFGIAGYLDELFLATKELLVNCKCESACHDCLKNFWNQKKQFLLNRNEAQQLLYWMLYGEMEKKYSAVEQKEIFSSIENVMKFERKELRIELGSDYLVVDYLGKSQKIMVIPAMYTEKYANDSKVDIIVSDKMIKYALPMAYERIAKK